jgi:hypothetical protein
LQKASFVRNKERAPLEEWTMTSPAADHSRMSATSRLPLEQQAPAAPNRAAIASSTLSRSPTRSNGHTARDITFAK